LFSSSDESEQPSAAGIVPEKPAFSVGRWRGTFAAAGGLFRVRKRKRQAHSMNKQQSTQTIASPAIIALAVAVFGIFAMLMVDHGPWSRPHLQDAEVAYPTTDAAARAVGAKVTPTAPKPAIEPDAPGPKPAQPANPAP
jgi:hypothetical protein